MSRELPSPLSRASTSSAPQQSARAGASAGVLAVLAALFAGGLAACSDTVVVPAETRLVAAMSAELDPDSVEVGDSVTAALAGNLEAGDRVLMAKGTRFHGTVTAVQEAEGRWPTVLNLHFVEVEVDGARDSLSTRLVAVDAATRGSDGGGGDETGEGLVGTVASGRNAAAMVRPDVQKEPGSSVVLGTAAARGYLPEGARIELELTAPLEVPPPGDG